MASATLDDLIVHNPASAREIGRVRSTPASDLPEIVARAREAQGRWDALGWSGRRPFLKRWWKAISLESDAWCLAIRDEIGKPRAEALAGDVIATLDALRWVVRHAGSALSPSTASAGHQRFLQLPSGRVERRPFGVIGMIGTWNYPLFLNAPPIAQALAAGNAVVWKPSELAPGVGARLQKSLEDAGFPEGLVSAVYGGPDVGRALVAADVDKGFFTGGVENGRHMLAALAARGVSGVAELSGFDPAVVLPDSPFQSTIKALAWASFVGAGQTCVAVKRVILVGDPRPWADALAAQARALRVGDPVSDDVDMGPLISESARERVHSKVLAAVEAGATILAGGEPLEGPGWYYPPTVLLADSDAPERALEGIFGPVVIVRGVPDAEAAVHAANSSRFGLAASVWSRDTSAALALAARLDAGTVTINDAVTTTMHASAPFGGFKASGFGRSHGPAGVLEFTQPRVTFRRGAGGFRPHLFPYGAMPIDAVFRLYRRIFH